MTKRRKNRANGAPVLIGVPEAAQLSGYSEKTLYRLLKRGVLRDVGIDGRHMMVREEFLRLITGRKDA